MKRLKKVFAFTLAEVLITFGVIGVVAAMTIPTLMTNLQNRKLESQFKEGYSILSQAFKSWQDDGLENRHYSRFMSYFTGVTDCGDTHNTKDDDEYCMVRTSNSDGSGSHLTNRDLSYRTFSKKSREIATYNLDDGQFYLQNGMLIMFDHNHADTLISMDINGKKQGPNIWGYDLFTFQVKENEITGVYELVPMGAPGTYITDKSIYCSLTSTDHANGIACAYYAMSDSGYFRKLKK